MRAVEPLIAEKHSTEVPAREELRVRIVRDFSGIEEIRPVWSAWQSHPNADIDFYLTVLRSLPDTLNPCILVLYRGNVPEAMLIGRVDKSRLEFKIGYKTLFRAKVRQLTFVNGGSLGNLSPENCQFLVSEIAGALVSEKVDVVFFNHLRTDSAPFQAIRRLPGFFTQDHFHAPVVHRSMILPPSTDELYRGLSAKVRKNLKWQAKKLLSEFPESVEVRTFAAAQDLARMIQDVEQIAKNTYQRGLGVGFVDSPEQCKRLSFEAERGWLRGYVLYIAGKPAAFWIGNLYGDTFHSNYMGYDANYSKYSVGMYLIMKTIEEMIEQSGTPRVAQIDFGLGDAQYKEVLGNSQWEEASPRIFSSRAKGICLSAVWGSTVFLDSVARKLLGKAGIVQKTKKIWRDRLRKGSTPPPESQ